MKKYVSIAILINLCLVIGLFNYAVIRKEDTLKNGQLTLIRLAPVDPRSLMQGDYMVLNYGLPFISNDTYARKRGYCVIKTDERGVVLSDEVYFQENMSAVADGARHIKCWHDSWRIYIGAESFFFQEGHGEKYEEAQYGGLMVDDDGNSILVGLYDGDLNRIE
ncbi:MAG: GDYXXLXY domain-containing protein [Proteobacteria bacterium]|nr:GDYXXLXY domain-containing protein [Pseudomonadota bacterium]